MKQNTQDNRWLDEIRTEMQDFKAETPADGWERLSSSLPSASSTSITRKRWFSLAASSLLIAVLGIAHYYFALDPLPVTDSLPDVAEVILQPVSPTASEAAPVVITTAESPKQSPTQAAAPVQIVPEPIREVTQHTQESAPTSAQPAQAPASAQPAQAPASTPTPASAHRQTEATTLQTPPQPAKHRKSESSWTLALHAGGHGSMSSLQGDEVYDNYDPTHGATEVLDPQPDLVIKSSHHTSYSFGLSVGRQVLPHTTLETGIVYTSLRSDVVLQHSGLAKQTIQYLGIPLQLNYQVMSTNQFQLYAGGGIMLEHSLSATRDGEKIDVEPWQWSTHLSLGGQYNLTKKLSLYLEPGVSWYFDADQTAPSLRSESPLYFNLKGGIRLTY